MLPAKPSLLLALALAAAAPLAAAQVNINIGPEPACPYGYYDYAPYSCSPYGYYGPTWFNGGAFIGVGPWFHGRGGYHGFVDNRFDPRLGYRGPLPARGERAFSHNEDRSFHNFHGNEEREGRGGFHGR